MQNTRSESTKPSASRRGSILVAALVCLAIVTLIMLSVFKTTLSQRHQIRLEQQQVQAELIAESGLERAAARLRNDAGYKGEDWTIEAQQLDSQNTATVNIKVTNSNNQATIAVDVEFPKGSVKRSRATRELTLKLPTNKPLEKAVDDKKSDAETEVSE